MSIEARFCIDQGSFQLSVELDLPATGVTSLFGPSGSGKTTLLRAIAGLERHAGCYLRFGDSVWQDQKTFLAPHRRPLAYVFQESSLFTHLNVRSNLEYGYKRLPAAKRRITLESAIELLEIGLLLERMPSTLSGGERQRVAIARALARSPKLLLLDEPLAAVDYSKKQEILPYIESLHQQLALPVIHVSHYPEEVARLADHLVLLDAGRVTGSGDVHDLFTRLDLPLAHAQDAASIIEATVSAHELDFGLTRLKFGGGDLTVSGTALAIGSPVRLRLAARDVSLTLGRQSETSILNILPATIEDIQPEGDSQLMVRLRAGVVPILSRITRKSAHELELTPGMAVFAQVKSIALLG